MPTATEAFGVIRGLIEANAPVHPQTGAAVPLGWQGEDPMALPDTPSPFVFTMFEAEKSDVIEIGRGRGGNRHRNRGIATILIFVPVGWGLQFGTNYAEGFASVFRPYAANGVSCESVTVYPGGAGEGVAVPGIANEAGNYFWSSCEVEFRFDLIG